MCVVTGQTISGIMVVHISDQVIFEISKIIILRSGSNHAFPMLWHSIHVFSYNIHVHEAWRNVNCCTSTCMSINCQRSMKFEEAEENKSSCTL